MAFLKVDNLNKSYVMDKENREIALKGLSMQVKSGEFVAIYGPSGCGKSTLLNIISGLDKSYEGNVIFDDKNLKNLSETELAKYRKEKVGFIFQNFNLIPHMTILENVMIPMKLNGEAGSNNKSKAMELLKSVGVGEYSNKRPNQLSGGQRQRVAIARALVNSPEVIIADEPTGALDSESQTLVLDILKELSDKGKLVVVVTHNNEVLKYADHVIKMKDGLIISDEIINRVQYNEIKQESSKYKFKVIDALKIAYNNFSQRKIRNLLVSLGTSIGLTGILLSLGLGTGVIEQINKEMGTGEIPTQIQVMQSASGQQGGYINEDNVKEVKNIIGEEKIKYFEMPFGLNINSIQIDDNSLDLSETYPSYAQLRNHYTSSEIKTASNTEKSVLAGTLYNNPDEQGITISKLLIDDYNEKYNAKLEYKYFVGKEVKLNLVQATPQGNKYTDYTTKIIRVLDSEVQINEENSYMGPTELESVIKNNGFIKIPSYMMVELKDVTENKEVVSKINEGKKYVAISQQGTINTIMNFIRIIQGLLAFMSSQAIVVATVMIGIVLHISVIERTREIGVMKAVGYKNKFVSQIFLAESFIISFLANIISITFTSVIGISGNAILKSYYPEMMDVYKMKLEIVVLVFVISSLLSILAGLIPARKAMKLDPANALRYE